MATALMEKASMRVLAESQAELDEERLTVRTNALAELEKIEREANEKLPPLELAAAKAKSKWQRGKAALEIAAKNFDSAGGQLDLAKMQLDTRRDRALAALEQTADPAWREAEEELRIEFRRSLDSRISVYGGRNIEGNPVVDKERVKFNERCKKRADAAMEAASKARTLRRMPTADPAVEIPKLWASLPAIELPNSAA